MTSADDWDKVESFFSQGLTADAKERDRLLSATDPAIAKQVRQLWNNWREAGNFLQTPAVALESALQLPHHGISFLSFTEGAEFQKPDHGQGTEARAPLDSTWPAYRSPGWHGREAPRPQHVLAGKPFGPYEVVRLLGEGGMGIVFEARRTDGEFERTVAIKVLKLGTLSSSLVKRFTRERQLLAQLNHPNIAVLIDGGTSNEGFPYLVAEFVPGHPIDTYCDQMDLTVDQRLRLFLKVCSAVAHAHSKLIVHQDLKPSNILVTPDGTPKLLDFGIAKSLDPSDEGRNTTVHTLFATPRYASPEQLAGLPVTTATDVYALGVIAYELLTGRTPDATAGRSSSAASGWQRGTEPLPPSSVAADRERTNATSRSSSFFKERLSRDIDTIILKAIKKRAEDRYQTVIEFAADIERLLAGQPIRSRPNTVGYRAAKFLLRHPVGVPASAAALLLLVFATFFSLREARIADRRSAIIRRIANSLIVETNEDVAGVPGAIPARKALVSRSLSFLEELQREGGNDAATLSDIAYAYLKIGDIQGGGGGSPNLGHVDWALQSYLRAATLLEQANALQTHNDEMKQRLIDAYADISSNYLGQRQMKDALRYAQKAMALSTTYARDSKSDKATLSSGRASSQYASLLANTGEYAPALQTWRETLVLYERYVAAHPERPLLQRNVAIVHKRTGAVLMMLKRYPEALAEYQAAVPIDEKVLALSPQDVTRQLDLSFDYVDPGEIYIRLHRPAEALRSLQRAVDIRAAAYKADPMNDRAVSSLASAYVRLADLYFEEQQFHLSASVYERAIVLYESEKGAGERTTELIETHFRAGKSFESLATASTHQNADLPSDYRKALTHYQIALKMRQPLSAAAVTGLSNFPAVETIRAKIAACQRALAHAASPHFLNAASH